MLSSTSSICLAFFAIALPLSECANILSALSVTPSTNWYGYDGDWSAVRLRLGSPLQWVDVIPNTQSSETWVVSPGGCNNNSLCTSMRGGAFNSLESNTWAQIGFYDLTVNKELGNTGYAEYGLDSLTLGSTGIQLPSTIIGTVNATDQWLGSFGLGVTPGSFGGHSFTGALSALVEEKGVIQSHSYGYTAGAKYQRKGTPNSLTLGGYDSNRFVQNTVSFTLNPSKQPQAFISSISVVSGSTSNNWTTPIQLLSSSDRVSAIIDSSTPYLWLPQDVCDVFAQELGLTFNASLNLYTFDKNPLQHDALRNAQLTFSFSLSDFSSSLDLVNITLPYAAFDLQLTFPAIPHTDYGSKDSTKFYFPLRRATNEAQYRIGRFFLQESYLITDYERNTFSVHQAVHTADPISNTSIVAISRDGLTTFSGPPKRGSKKLSAGAITGIVVGIAIISALTSFILFWVCRGRKHVGEDKREKNHLASEHRTFFGRFLRRGNPAPVHETNGSVGYATEMGADAMHERFELPAPLGPVELDSESGTTDGRTNSGVSENLGNLSTHELLRRRAEGVQAGNSTADKSDNDVSNVAHYRAPESEYDSALISPIGGDSENSLSYGQPSPMTPGFSSQENFPPPTYRRINPANVVYVGRLPDNVQLPQNVPKVVGRDGRTIRSEPSDPPASMPHEVENSTLGSQYTDLESDHLYEESSSGHRRTASPELYGSEGIEHRSGSREPTNVAQLREMDDMGSGVRVDGEDLVHIPQPAEHRFSWEEERISGIENSL